MSHDVRKKTNVRGLLERKVLKKSTKTPNDVKLKAVLMGYTGFFLVGWGEIIIPSISRILIFSKCLKNP